MGAFPRIASFSVAAAMTLILLTFRAKGRKVEPTVRNKLKEWRFAIAEVPASEITKMLLDWSGSSSGESTDALFKLVYDELHRQAEGYLRKERVGHTLQTSALVHEAYFKLVEQKSVNWQSRSHFFAIAATIMRRILIDYARRRHRARCGGIRSDVSLDQAANVAVGDSEFDVLALDEALDRLAEKELYLAKVVELRFFSGLDVPETAKILGVSESTVKRDWQMAKAWLHRELMR